MTTLVRIVTADHAARVLKFPCDDNGQPLEDGEYSLVAEVPPHSQQDFAAHRHADLLVQEMPDADA